MWKKVRRLSALMLAMMMFLCGIGSGNVVHAAKSQNDSLIEELSSKTATELSQGRYEITVSVPGAESEKYNEIILMIDASGSQFTNMAEVSETILDIGENVLNEYGTMHLTLMHFGIAGGNLFTATTMEELEDFLADTTYKDLERWPTATNCEAGFVHLQEYIAASPNLQNAYIMYTSDGETNLSEEAKVWYDWKNHPEWYFKSVDKNSPYTDLVEKAWTEEKKWLNAGEGLSAPTKKIFAEIVAEYGDDTAALKTALETAIRANEYELGKLWVDEAWKQAYDGAGLDYNTAYSIGTVEKAFISVHGMERTWHWLFAYTVLNYSAGYAEDHHTAPGYSMTAPSKGHRAAAAANKLAAMEQVEELYLIGMGAYSTRMTVLTSWMNASEENIAKKTANVFADHEKITFLDGTYTSDGTNYLMVVLKELGEQLSLMPMNDVYVVDPMSKWVNLEEGSIRIYDGDTCIWDQTTGWLVQDPPVEGAPITLDTDPTTGHDRITWKVKDGALLSSDSYSMKYYVTVNKEAEGFVDGKLYPANDPTTVHYTDENNEPQEEDVKVPLVKDGETPEIERIIDLTKYTSIENPDGTTSNYPLEGIQFDLYYIGTVDYYTANIETLKTPSMAVVAGKTPIETLTTGTNGKAVYNLTENGQPDGIYMLVEKAHPAVKKVLDPFYVAVPMTKEDGSGLEYVVEVGPKNDLIIPEIAKDVTKIENNLDSVNAGEEFTWIVRGDVPADIADAKYYEITDTLDYRLTYAEDLVVKVEKVDAAANNSVSSGDVLTAGTDYTLSVKDKSVDVSGGDAEATKEIVVTLTDVGLDEVARLVGEASEDYEIRVYFNTTIDVDAAMGEEIPNQATLKYTNSTNFEFEVKSDIPKVYTCGININKFDAKDNSIALKGAEFMVARAATAAEIADENIATETLVIGKGDSMEVVFVSFYNNAALTGERVNKVTTGEDGKAVIYGLEEDTYYLVETKAPAGYNLLSYPKEIELNRTSHLETNAVGVANSNTFELPTTGGIGTTIFTLVGAALTLGSGAVLAGKKRKEE